jgi:DNA-binding IclR family transcriptional regulator
MDGSKLPRSVEAFVERHFATGAQVQVLLLLHGQRERAWTVDAIARELHIDQEHAELLVVPLVESGLLSGGKAGYRYDPRTARLADEGDSFVAAFPTYRVAIIRLIYSKPRRSLRDFSDAFRLKDEE